MIAYTGIETISNMAEEAKDEAHTIPAAIKGVVLAVFAIYALLPAVALSALPVTCNAAGKCQTLLGLSESSGWLCRRPGAGDRQAPATSGPLQHAGRDLRRPAGRDDPVHRHQRRDHRRLAAGLLDGAAPPGAGQAAPAAPAIPHAVDRDHRVRGDRLHHADPRAGDVPGQHVRVRRDAVVHDRPPRGDPIADQGPRPRAALPRSRHAARSPDASCRCSRCWAGSAPGSRS